MSLNWKKVIVLGGQEEVSEALKALQYLGAKATSYDVGICKRPPPVGNF